MIEVNVGKWKNMDPHLMRWKRNVVMRLIVGCERVRVEVGSHEGIPWSRGGLMR